MAALLKALQDGHTVVLRFTTKEDARRFKKFTNTYMEESGAGNGYGAYWVLFDMGISKEDTARICYTCREQYPIVPRLNRDLVDSMLAAIMTARLAKRGATMDVALTVGEKDGAITFAIGVLPERQRPKAGDMFRALNRTCSEAAREVGEGRVIHDNGETLGVISCWDEGDNGEPKRGARVITVRANEVMKINDWKAEHRRVRG